MFKKDQLSILKDKYEKLYEKFSLEGADKYNHIITWLENDIYRIEREIRKAEPKNIYSLQAFQLYLPIELEKKARDNAKKVGLVKDDEGILSGYISFLINKDLKDKTIIDRKIEEIEEIDGILYEKSKQKKVSIYLTKEQQVLARKRALELGFIWGDKGNLSRYIKLLIALDS